MNKGDVAQATINTYDEISREAFAITIANSDS